MLLLLLLYKRFLSLNVRQPFNKLSLTGDSAEEDTESDEWEPIEKINHEPNTTGDSQGMDFAFPEDEFDSISVSDMKKAEVIEAEEELLMKERGEDLDSTVQSEFKTEGRRVKLYTIEEESSEDEEDQEDEEGDEKEMEEGEWMKKKRPQGLSELEKYFLLLGGETEFSQQF